MTHDPQNSACDKNNPGSCGGEKCIPDTHSCTCQESQTWEDSVKHVISEDIDSAFDSFSTSNGYWEHGEMRSVGVVADRIIEKMRPLISQAIATAIKMERERILAGVRSVAMPPQASGW